MMKKLYLMSAVVVGLMTSQAYAATAQSFVSVNGLVCDFCARALEKTFGQQEAVDHITVDLNTKIITIYYKDGQSLSEEKIIQLITDSGYNVVAVADRLDGLSESDAQDE